jgi:stage V sporulation protein R
MARPSGELLALQQSVEALARAQGLDFPEIRYELVDHRQLNEIAAYGGFPARYPHWRFGMDYDRLAKGHAWGLQRIYELVINTRPVVAYLLGQNAAVEQKLVMAHVCGHADFFQNNAWFAHTEPDMIDQLASHGARIRTLMDHHGLEVVEDFVDIVLSVDNLLDVGAMGRARGQPGNAPPLDKGAPERDILGHLLLGAPLEGWQQEVLSMLRDEAYYFLPQGMTKIMNEGWASFWHSRLMTGELLRDAEVVAYAEQHSGAMGSEGQLNPYKLGIELYRSLWRRHGGDDGGGLEAVFEARAIHDDLTFVEEHLDEAFCEDMGLVSSREEFLQSKEGLLDSLTNAGQPVIRRVDAGGAELELEHCWSGSELELEATHQTLRNLCRLWHGPVRLTTRLEGRHALLSCTDGEEVGKELGEPVDGSQEQAA